MIRRPPRSTLFPYTRSSDLVMSASLIGRLGSSVLQTIHHCSVDVARSEEHTSELQSHLNLVCRLLLEKKNSNKAMLTPTRVTEKMCRYTSRRPSCQLLSSTS